MATFHLSKTELGSWNWTTYLKLNWKLLFDARYGRIPVTVTLQVIVTSSSILSYQWLRRQACLARNPKCESFNALGGPFTVPRKIPVFLPDRLHKSEFCCVVLLWFTGVESVSRSSGMNLCRRCKVQNPRVTLICPMQMQIFFQSVIICKATQRARLSVKF